ncbi:hypothetical protein ACFLUV_04075, partial [Elusimicrobiota bacterium]
QIYYILSAVMVTNIKSLFFLLIALSGAMYILVGGRMSSASAVLSARERFKSYLYWILKFLTPIEKLLKSCVCVRTNDPAFKNFRRIMGKMTRTLRIDLECGFFLYIHTKCMH